MGKNAVVQKVFHGLKKVYLKLPVDKEAKIKAKNAFYKVFGPLFKNTPSYQQWAYIHAKSMKKKFLQMTIITGQKAGMRIRGTIISLYRIV